MGTKREPLAGGAEGAGEAVPKGEPVHEFAGGVGDGRGLTLVHFSAQPMPCWSHLPVSPCLIDWGKIMQSTYAMERAYVELKRCTSVSPWRRAGRWNRADVKSRGRITWRRFVRG
jgi:hypothetical protein